MTSCPCGSQYNYISCCGKYLDGSGGVPATPEELMRSRYTAYSSANIPYIKKTMRGRPLAGFNEKEAEYWAKNVIWIGLRVVNTSIEEDVGYVEFIAQFMEGSYLRSIHENSEFHKQEEAWFYVDGVQQPTNKVVITRNMPCPCGSQKKFKNCHAKG